MNFKMCVCVIIPVLLFAKVASLTILALGTGGPLMIC